MKSFEIKWISKLWKSVTIEAKTEAEAIDLFGEGNYDDNNIEIDDEEREMLSIDEVD